MDREKVRQFMDQFMDMATSAALLGVASVADRSGLFAVLAGLGPRTISDIAVETGFDARYLREVLSALAAGGIVTYDPARETFNLPAEHAACLSDEASPYFLGGWTQMMPAFYRAVPGVAHALREGGGVAYGEYGHDVVEGIDRVNSPGMRILLTRKWLPAMPDVLARLEEGMRVADVGCGSGTAVIAMAEAYPNSEVIGFDMDATSIERASTVATAEGVANARFERISGEELPTEPGFDLVTAFDVIHDLARPRGVLRRIKAALKPGGTFLMVEPAAADALEDNLNPHGTLLYAMSTLYCMTVSLAEGGEGLGAAWGARRAEELCREAGFTHFRRLEIVNPFNAFYEVR
jgi:ubiquinone/menaquinone biosynthesis C-methylase UbiE